MSIVDEYVRDAKNKVDPGHLSWESVNQRLTEANGFKVTNGVGGELLIVNPNFDPDNIVDPYAVEWMIVWSSIGRFLNAPDLFFVWWNNPADLKFLIEEGHLEAHYTARNTDWVEREKAFFQNFAEQREQENQA